MATNFPTSLDSLTNPTASDKLNSVTVPHATQHSTLNDAVEALEAKVGVDGSAVTTSHDYLIAKQSVVPYADASARTTAVPSPVEGQMSYLEDTNAVEVYNGTDWVSAGGVKFAKALRNTDLTLTSAGTSVFDSNLNVTVDAAAGDVISYTFDTYIAAGANLAHFMPYTLDAGGAIVNPVANAGTTFNPAIWQTAESTAKSFTFLYELVAGDIVSNQVTVGLTVKTAGASRQIVYGTIGMRCYLTNLGPEVS